MTKNLFILAKVKSKKRITYQNIFFKTLFEYIIVLISVFDNNAIANKKIINSFFVSKSYLIKTKEIKHIIQYFA